MRARICVGAVHAHGALQHLPREADAALGDVAVRVGGLDDLLVHRLGVLGRDRGQPGHLDRDLLHGLLGQVLEELRGGRRAERDAEDRGLAARREGGGYSFIH